MVNQIANAAAAYANAATQSQGPGMEARAEPPGTSFGDMVRDLVTDGIDAQRQAEQASADALVGRADLNDVVMAVNNAEMGLQMIVGLRDRIIEAYQEILRMPI